MLQASGPTYGISVVAALGGMPPSYCEHAWETMCKHRQRARHAVRQRIQRFGRSADQGESGGVVGGGRGNEESQVSESAGCRMRRGTSDRREAEDRGLSSPRNMSAYLTSHAYAAIGWRGPGAEGRAEAERLRSLRETLGQEAAPSSMPLLAVLGVDCVNPFDCIVLCA